MRHIFFTAVVLIVLGVAWTLYLQLDNTRFVESLPQAPSSTHREATADPSLKSGNENVNSELPAGSHVQRAAIEPFELPPDTPPRPSPVGRQDPTFRIQREREGKVMETSESEKENLQEESESSPSSTFQDLSLEQLIENNRQRLIDQHGEIPEIDRYLELNRSFFQQILEGKTQITVDRTPEESLENSRLTALLFPTEANQKAYQDELKKMKEYGIIK